MELPKSYETVARLGARSSTGDPEGEIAITGRLPPESDAAADRRVRQRPPIYSAVKIDGERAYARARRGERFEMPERDRHRLRLRAALARGRTGRAARAAYLIDCSAGTYVRSLIADLGDAYCVELRRTAIGPFEVRDALPPPRRGEPWRRPEPDRDRGALAALPQPQPQRACARERSSERRARPPTPTRPRTLRLPARGGHSPARRRAQGGRAAWPSAPSTACTSATAR